MSSISAVIITKNEEKMLPDCLKSLEWVDEVLVVDTGSIDDTLKIAKKFRAKIVDAKSGKNFSDWRNKGLSLASGEWILYIDADERVTEELQAEITNLEFKYSAYAIPRRNVVLGKELKHGGLYPDYQKRLFKKGKLKGWRGDLHEEPEINGNLSHLESPMIHIKHENFSEMVAKTNKWSEIEARLMFESSHPPMNIPRFLTAMTREFWQRMIVQKAFLDGKEGVVYAMYQVFSRFISYAKLWEMQVK